MIVASWRPQREFLAARSTVNFACAERCASLEFESLQELHPQPNAQQ
jgi:hypothetical protein